LPATSAADYLSGMLLGAELASALPSTDATLPLVLVGEAALCERYEHALRYWERGATRTRGALAATGLWALARDVHR
jgi:2-dehydro-3-deoxygalactonokinase